jgi:hypothetical protein
MYRIRQIDTQDDEVLDTLGELHRLTFFDGAPVPEFDQGDWWLALHGAVPVGFAGFHRRVPTMPAIFRVSVC